MTGLKIVRTWRTANDRVKFNMVVLLIYAVVGISLIAYIIYKIIV